MAEITLNDISEQSVRRRGTALPEVIDRLGRLARRWRKARRDRRTLAGMDARTRRDIGVSAGDVRSVVGQPWWRWPLN